jgi:hypothetical protein
LHKIWIPIEFLLPKIYFFKGLYLQDCFVFSSMTYALFLEFLCTFLTNLNVAFFVVKIHLKSPDWKMVALLFLCAFLHTKSGLIFFVIQFFCIPVWTAYFMHFTCYIISYLESINTYTRQLPTAINFYLIIQLAASSDVPQRQTIRATYPQLGK